MDLYALHGLAGWVEKAQPIIGLFPHVTRLQSRAKLPPIAGVRKTRRQTDQGTFESDYGSIFRRSHHPAIYECTQ